MRLALPLRPVVHVAFDGDLFAACGAPAPSLRELTTQAGHATCAACLDALDALEVYG